MAQPLTYQDLLNGQDKRVLMGTVHPQTAANRATALRVFMGFLKLSAEDPVGQEFRAMFLARCHELSDHLRTAGKTPRNVGNTLSALKSWRPVVVAIDTDHAISGDKLTPFAQAFRALLNGTPVKLLARTIDAAPGMLYGWQAGKNPRLSNSKYLTRVERYFGLPDGELSTLAGFRHGSYEPKSVGEPLKIAYRDGLKAKSHYVFKPALDSPLRKQWHELLVYKTARVPTLIRSNKGVWRLSPHDIETEREGNWYRFLNGSEVPTAHPRWNQLASFLGWLAMPVPAGGMGVPESELHTLAWLTHSAYAEKYVDWLIARAGNLVNGSVIEFLAFIKSMTRPVTGYLWQLPSFAKTLPLELPTENWQEHAETAWRTANASAVALRPLLVQTRDPSEPMKHILDTDSPLEFVADMVQRMRADRPLGRAPYTEARWARNVALIKFLVSNPLRVRNVCTLTWRDDNSGLLYQRPDRSWWVRVPKVHFKNFKGAASDNEYDMPVQETVWQDLERYLTLRPRLLNGPSDYLFIGAGRGPRATLSKQPWEDLSRTVEDLTRKYLWRCPGIGTHAFRHLVATAIIKASKNSDYKTAALVLNDRLSTVERNYAHLKSSDGAKRMDELLGDVLRRM
ncbi:MAG: hypothetical protein V4844_12905 [Pseudomonadota bacterium]